ncbi:hypothetical protein PSTG_19029, partial [Puccinia striiformis f. sp. tritici PST-78]
TATATAGTPIRPPYRVRRATDSALKPVEQNLDCPPEPTSKPRSSLSSRQYLTGLNLNHPTPSQSFPDLSCLKALVFTSLWISSPTLLGRLTNPDHHHHHHYHHRKSYLGQSLEFCVQARLGLSKPILWLILLLVILGAIDLWRGNERTLDNQDWGPTRFRVGRQTGAETRRLKRQR